MHDKTTFVLRYLLCVPMSIPGKPSSMQLIFRSSWLVTTSVFKYSMASCPL